LHTEPKFWTNFNFVFLIFFIVISFYNLTFLGDENDILKVGTNLFLLFGIYGIFRFIHSIFFIPDSLTSKYLDTKDKFAKEFKY
jgi:prolipoprotein diacylglyceryltransferase